MRRVALSELQYVGHDLDRPECVMATRSGDIFVPDRRGGINIIRANRHSELVMAKGAPDGFLPNGIALLADRSFLIANIGPSGGVYHMARDGSLQPRLLEIDGRRLEPTNFVGLDRQSRIWVSVSTRLIPREQSMRKGYGDGYIVLIDSNGRARVVAENLGYTNEVIVDPTGQWLYVAESMGRRTSRFRILDDGSLGAKEVFATYDLPGTFPDGFAFDAEGAVWIASVVSNRVIRACLDETQQVILEDMDSGTIDEVEAAFHGHRLTRNHVDAGKRRPLGNLSSVFIPICRSSFPAC